MRFLRRHLHPVYLRDETPHLLDVVGGSLEDLDLAHALSPLKMSISKSYFHIREEVIYCRIAYLVLEWDGLPQPDEGQVDRVDPPPLARVPLGHQVRGLLAVRNVL